MGTKIPAKFSPEERYFIMKRKYRVMTIDEIREISIYGDDESLGICALVDVLDMGWCKDGKTRWYTFFDENGKIAIYFKH